MSERQVSRIFNRAIQRGFDPTATIVNLCTEHIQNAPRSGRPKVVTPEYLERIERILTANRNSREILSRVIARELSSLLKIRISHSTICTVLKKAGYKKVKPTRKPGLTKRQRAARLKWCLDHKNWS